MNKKLAIYINSFDGYSDLWKPFFDIFDMNWKTCNYEMYLVSNFKDYKYKKLKMIKTGKEKNWFNRTRVSLEKIEEEYILFFLEDYFIGKKVKEKDIEDIMRYIEKNKILYYKLIDIPISKKKVSNMEYLGEINRELRYGINLQCAIWKKEYLLEVLKKMGNKLTPWEFEVSLVNENFKYILDENYKKMKSDKRDILKIKNGVYKGKWAIDTVNYFEKLGYKIDTSKREILSSKQMVKYKIIRKINWCYPSFVRKSIKYILKLLGVKFYSKF